MIISTSETILGKTIDWLYEEVDSKIYGEVKVSVTIRNGMITDIKRESVEQDHFNLQPFTLKIKTG